MPGADARMLTWGRFPNYDQLDFCCSLIWKHLVEQSHAGVFSGSQLAFKANRLRTNPDVRARILDELSPGPFAARTADKAVERVLEFDRTWASFELPRLLKALEDVQAHVLSKRGAPSGEYGFFINQLENLFRRPFQVPLEEYGLPLQITDKMLTFLQGVDSIDDALALIKDVPSDRLTLEPFERELLDECKPYL